jgi:hypothetical protein
MSTRESFPLGQTDIPGNPKYFLRTDVTSANISNCWVANSQRFEDLSLFIGKTLTISFWAKADSSKYIGFECLALPGVGGSSTITGISPKLFKMSSTWKYFTHTFKMPSSIVIGTNSSIQLSIWLDSGSIFAGRNGGMVNQDGVFDLSRFQVEYGSIATEFEHRSIGEELKACQRYYQKSYNQTDDPGTISQAGQIYEPETRNQANASVGVRFITKMQTVPTISLYSPLTGTIGYIDNDGDKTAIAADMGESGFSTLVAINSNGGVIGSPVKYHYTADAEL